MLILVPSHDDAASLRRSLPAIRDVMRADHDRLVVIADRCTDDTAEVARISGADVVVRSDETTGSGKGGALRFALSVLPAHAGEAVAIFDADSVPSARFFDRADARLAAGDPALQAYVDPVPGRAVVSRIAAYSEIVSQRISGRIREAFGWGVALRGTGMVIERELLEGALPRCATFVEDLELTLLFAADGVHVHSFDVAVRDPKPDTARGAIAQRARWLAGNVAALSARRREIGRLLRSVSGATLVLTLFAKPRSLFFSARLALFLVLLPWASVFPGTAIEILLGILLLRDLALLFGGFLVVDRPMFYVPAVLAAPIYPFLWAIGAVRSVSSRRRWLSARRDA